MSPIDVKGWCPGAYHPMMSGDGLVVRIRPDCARLNAEQVHGLAKAAQRYGNGTLDLTNRANLQIRGVAPEDHDNLLRTLASLDLLDVDPGIEQRRNIIVTPFWTPGDLTERLARRLIAALARLPALPAKFGFAVDTGPAPLLADASADLRLEQDATGGLLLRADGRGLGRPVDEETAIPALIEMATWFAANARGIKRFAKLSKTLPKDWTVHTPATSARHHAPGEEAPLGAILGAPFGQIDASALNELMRSTNASGMRVTPWRLFLLEHVGAIRHPAFISHATDPILNTDACPGAPACPQASVETRDLARRLAPVTQGRLHVSGCAKGCARSRPAETTLVGRNGRFDLVRKGCAWDEPVYRGLTPDDLTTTAL